MGFSSSMAHSWGSRAPSHQLPFPPPQEKSGWASSITLCPLGGGAALSKFHLPCLMRSNSLLFFFFAAAKCWNLSLGNQDFYKALSSSISQCPPGIPGPQPRGAEAGSQTPAGSTASVKVCLPVTRFPPLHRPRLVYGRMVCISQLPQRYFCS